MSKVVTVEYIQIVKGKAVFLYNEETKTYTTMFDMDNKVWDAESERGLDLFVLDGNTNNWCKSVWGNRVKKYNEEVNI